MLKRSGGRFWSDQNGGDLSRFLLSGLAPFFVYFLLNAVFTGGAMALHGSREGSQVEVIAASAAADVCSAVSFLFFWRREQRAGRFPPPPDRRTGSAPAALSALTAAVSVYVLITWGITQSRIPEWDSAFQSASETFQEIPLFLLVALSVILAPVTEEFLFRGFLLRRLCVLFGRIPAVLISALFFALFHGNLTQGIAAFVIGVLLAAVRLGAQNLLLPILMHACVNGTALLLAESGITERGITGGPIFLMGLAAIFSIRIFLTEIREEEQKDKKKQKERQV